MRSSTPELPPLVPAGRRAPRDVLQIAHRGGMDGAEDYRQTNLHRIADLGTHLVEIDLQATSDGLLVVHHDPELMVDGRVLSISAHRLADLAERIPPGKVHAAATVVRAARRAGLGIYADIKYITESAASSLVELLVTESMTGRSILASADTEIIAHFAVIAPNVPRAVLFRSVDEDPLQLTRAAHANFVHPCWEDEARPDQLLAGSWLARVRNAEIGVIAWHEERPEVLAGLLKLGVDGICTDEPALLARLAASHD